MTALIHTLTPHRIGAALVKYFLIPLCVYIFFSDFRRQEGCTVVRRLTDGRKIKGEDAQ